MEKHQDEATIVELRAAIAEVRAANLSLARRNADLERHNKELREAVDALLQPAPSELLAHNLAHPSRQALHKPEE